MRQVLWLVLVFFLVTNLCFANENRAAAPLTKIVMGGSRNLGMIPVIALKKGCFAEEGLDVEYQEIQVGKLAMDALVAGKIDLGFIVDTNVAFGGFQQSPLRVIASIMKRGDDAIVYRKAAKIDKPLDLKGKKIGYLPATTSHAFLDRFLKSNGLSVGDVTLVILQPASMQSAMEGGQVDAVSCWQPWCRNIIHALPDQVGVFKNPTSLYPSEALLATRDDLLKKDPESLKKFLRALIKAEEFIQSHPAEAQAIMAEEMALAPETLAEIWPEFTMHVDLKKSILNLVNSHGAWIVNSQEDFKGKELPYYRYFFDPSILKSIDPKRVSGF